MQEQNRTELKPVEGIADLLISMLQTWVASCAHRPSESNLRSQLAIQGVKRRRKDIKMDYARFPWKTKKKI